MKYRVILEVIFNNGTDDKVGIYTYDSKDKALKGFYDYMRMYVAEPNVAIVNVICKDSEGYIYRNEMWQNSSTPTVPTEE